MSYFPVYLNLTGKRCLVVGGGPTAVTKVKGLLQAGAEVEVVAPQVENEIRHLNEQSQIEWLDREYQAKDGKGAFLVVSTLENRGINEQIFEQIDGENRLVNVHDDGPRCNFIYPAVARSGSVQVAVSTAGKSPALAVRLRDRIREEILSGGSEALADFIEERRGLVKERLPTFALRREFWNAVVDSRISDLLRDGDPAADEEFGKLLRQLRAEEKDRNENSDSPLTMAV